MMKNQILYFGFLGAFVTCSLAQANTVTPSDTDPRKVMEAVRDRQEGNQKGSRLKMTIRDSGGRTRERVIQTAEIQLEGSEKSMVFFESPADVRNVALLTVDYNESVKSDDQWLYMPKLRRTARIGSNKRSGSFMGSDFTFGDMTRSNPELYDFEMLKQEVMVDGEPCWLIESRPKTKAEEEESGSIKQHYWISKEKFIAARIKSWVRKGKKLRYLSQDQFKKVNGIWTAFLTQARTVRNGKVESESSLQVLEVKHNVSSITASQFSLRTLEKGI